MDNKNLVVNKAFPYILISLGCFLLILGNTLSWPCYPGSWRGLCDPSLDVPFVTESGVGYYIVAITLMLLLEVNLLNHPMNYVAWASYWIILYFVLIAKIRTDSFLPGFHFQLVRINWSLLTIMLTPLSLLSYWLALRPQDIKQRYRKVTLICLFALLTLTVFFLLFAVIALDLRIRYSFEWKEVVSIAPVAILGGTLLLIGAEYTELFADKRQSVKNNEEEKEDVDELENDIVN